MSKEEFLKIQTCVLKVNIHCDGCKSKVKKTLQKIDGVYKIHIDSEMGKVTVSGNVDPDTLIKKLGKSGKHAELWGAPKANQGNQNQLNAQFKNLHIDNSKGGNKGQKGGGNQQKAGGGGGGGGQPGLTPQQLQLLQMKGLQDMKLPQLKDLKMPFSKDQNQKAVKFNLPEEDDMSDDEFDCFDDEDYDDDDELDDELGGAPPAPNKMKPIMGNGQMPNLMMLNGQQLPQFMNAQAKGGNGANNNGGNGKKGGGGNVPVQVNDGKNDNGGKKGGGGGKNGGKNGGGNPGEGKNGNNSGGAQSKNGNGGHGGGGGGNSNNNGNGGKKGGGMNDGVPGLPNMGSGFQGMAGGHLGQMGGMPMGQMGHLPMGQMPAVQGLPAGPLNAGPLNAGGGGGGVGGYLNGAGQEGLAANSYQQHLAAAMMNQQRANGNERFQPMMYARPPPAVNYMPPPYQYPYPYPPPPDHPYTHAFSDESTSSCSVM